MSTGVKKRLYKSIEYRFLTGVAAGMGDYLHVSHTSIRILFILLTLASGVGLVLYITLSILLPTENEVMEQLDRDFYYNVTHPDMKDKHNIIDQKTSKNKSTIFAPQNIIALIIISYGIFILQFNIVPWELIPEDFRYPSLLITAGFGFVLKSISSKI